MKSECEGCVLSRPWDMDCQKEREVKMKMNKIFYSNLWRFIKKHSYVVLGIIIIPLLLNGFYFESFEFMKSSEFIYSLTGLIVYFYTYETHRMRKEIANQTKILSSPFISVFIEKDYEDLFKPEKLWVRNNGEVTARNVELIALQDFYEGEEDVSFKPVDTLPKGETEEVKIERKSKADDKITCGSSQIFTTNFLKDLKTRSLTREVSYKLKFKNIFDEPYRADVIFKDEEFLIKNFEKE
jgi:hypothetical protein